MEWQDIKTLIRQELPYMFQTDPSIRQLVLELTRDHYANKQETTDRFEIMLAEIHALRDEGNRRWEAHYRELQEFRQEQNQKWAENDHKLQEFRQEQNQKWAENDHKLQEFRQEQNQKWAENDRKWDEQNQKWAENLQQHQNFSQDIHRLSRRIDSSLGALGTRWGMQTEQAFRAALTGILEDSFGVTVEQVTLWDAQGEVFGRPDQVELDVIIKNGVLILCEIKASVSRSDLYSFWKKANFYAVVQQREVNRRIIVSPMIDPRAQVLAQELNIETFSHADEVTNLS